MKKQKITTIIFDLSEVYLKGLIGVEHYLEPVLKMEPKEIYSKLIGENFGKLMHGKITEDEYWQEINDILRTLKVCPSGKSPSASAVSMM